MKIPKIPIDLKTLGKAGQAFIGQGSSDIVVNILVDKTAPLYMIDSCREALMPAPGSARVSVNAFYETMPKLETDASLTIVLAGSSEHGVKLLEVAMWSEHPLICLTTQETALLGKLDQADAVTIAENILAFPTTQNPQDAAYQQQTQELFIKLAKWCSQNIPDQRIGLAKAFGFMRQIIAFDLTKQTALENAVISAVFFLPGSDLPVLTLNQAKLLYQIAVIFDIPLTSSRFKELAVVIAGAFGCRTIVRVLLKQPKPLAWAMRGAISFAATMTIGELAYKFYSQGGEFKQLGEQPQSEDRSIKAQVAGLSAKNPLKQESPIND